ncbi:uncharacterized protein LOC133373771 [Rhineura floridana]|uniref:uncharacterized protein LOC133373771 n=1 Tax=Rhineura floridana TaxID=261503 RepID=UPI002AC8000C|nr:uncharacterized protein LOC133373771 [Rhineura floridana]XP_061459937.1 uncharacterized protein LOC133373771 [Rhineura floridana]XP_061459938.1 uncharacterized protein LOC133373771 [Rhineura floridana]
MKKADNLAKIFRLSQLRRSRHRREGSLAAALAQSMALAIIGTAGAYPSWVLVQNAETQIVLGAAWAIIQNDPAPGTPLLGPTGGQLMLAIAFCCLFSVPAGSLALTLDFFGRQRYRSLTPLMHGLTAVLIACTAALGSCLLALVRGRIRADPELSDLSTSPGQSLFLAFLACTLASTATGFSCVSPARVEPARSSWDLGRPGAPRYFHSSVSSEGSSVGSDLLHSKFLSSLHLDTSSTVGGHSGKTQWYNYMTQNQFPPIFLEELKSDTESSLEDHSLLRRQQQQQSEDRHSLGEQQQNSQQETPFSGARDSPLEVHTESEVWSSDSLFLGQSTSTV